MPETILMLTAKQALAHQQEVLLQLFILLTLRTQLLHAAYDGSIYPSISAAPVAILSIFLFVGRHIIGIAPPQPSLGVEETAAAFVTCPTVHLHGVVAVFLLASYIGYLHVEWHRHLYGINPSPPTVQRVYVGLGLRCGGLFLGVGCSHLVIQISYDIG